MNPEDLDAIEHDLGIQLPLGYRRAALAGQLVPLANSDRRAVIAINQAFRDGEFGDVAWPNNMFAFGEDGAGNFYCLDVAQGSQVFLRDHETLEVLPEADDLERWLTAL